MFRHSPTKTPNVLATFATGWMFVGRTERSDVPAIHTTAGYASQSLLHPAYFNHEPISRYQPLRAPPCEAQTTV
ncbi:hypothetical protein RSSM_03603 [Rhodopirellula sallentina SM41]|uniref:Uncharacterized protein n=1 Tax=Rhodopirellula sallentina SM41 TaxID=1263870 RepID=M5U0D6_9BACT|nr:hypothetical protein RSSM_03603 [Rhodopirellula sallentina SM41]